MIKPSFAEANKVKPQFFTSLLLVVCMVFSTTTTAFLHLNEHKLEQSHLDLSSHEQPHLNTDAHDDHDISTEHAHHFNLHVTADLVEHNLMMFSSSGRIADSDFASRVISRSYTPPIPPPNA